MSIGRTGLNVSKQAIETTSHNISNANTEGFSRQRIDQQANRPVRKNGIIVGTGASINGVNRVEEKLLTKKIINTTSEHEFHRERDIQLRQVEELFNEVNADGLHLVMSKFFNAFRDLATEPENETMRSLVKDTAEVVTRDFRRIGQTLDTASQSIDQQIRISVDQINHLTESIAKTNRQIAEFEGSGDTTGDLRDERDRLVKDLAKIIPVHTYVDNRGNFVVNAKNVGSLVSAGQTTELMAKSLNREQSTNDRPGSVEVFFKGRSSANITKKISGGELGALFQTKNNTIYSLKKNMDELAYNFVNRVNDIHRQGFKAEGYPANLRGDQINFFQEIGPKTDASTRIFLSDEVQDDLQNIVTSIYPNTPGNNEVALKISDLQFEKNMNSCRNLCFT